MRLTQKELEYWLVSIDPIGPVKTARLLERFETEERIYEATREELEHSRLDAVYRDLIAQINVRNNQTKDDTAYKPGPVYCVSDDEGVDIEVFASWIL